MRSFGDVRSLPGIPAVYVFWSRDSNGRGKNDYPVYVGLTGNLRDRMVQHLWRRDSSVATGTTAVLLNPDYLTQLQWWTVPEFANKDVLQAAEDIAFRTFDPVLRDRGRSSKAAQELLKAEEFCSKMKTLFDAEPGGVMRLYSLEDALERLQGLERDVAELKAEMARQRGGDRSGER